MSDDRIFPHNLSAERSVLGAILIDQRVLPSVLSILQPRDFFRRSHQAVYRAMLALDAKKSDIDVVTLMDAITRTGETEEVGGAAYIAQMTDGMPRSTSATHYALIVRDESRRREMIKTAKELTDRAYNAELTTTETLARADRALMALARGQDSGRMMDMASSHGQLIETLEHRVQHCGQLLGVTSGSAEIDAVTFGFQPGELIFLGARPSVGKTASALNIAVATARASQRVAYFSIEMRMNQLQARMLASLSGVPLTHILTGYLTHEELQRIKIASDEMQALPISVDDAGSQTVHSIRATCRVMKSEMGLGLVIVDYVQLMAGTLERRGVTRNEELADISRRLKILSDEIQAPVIVLSQLSRAASDRPPTLADLRDSGAFEQDADIVAFLHRKNHRESGKTKFIIEKQRNGPTGTVTLLFDRDTQTFTDAPQEVEATEVPPPPEGETTKRRRRS